MIGIVRIALTRPLTFIVMAILIAIVGILAAIRTPVDIFPDIRVPVIAVAWQYAGLAPGEMAGRIITPYERILSTTVNDIEHIESQSLPGVGVVKIFLQPGTDTRTATAQVTSVSQSVLRQLPPGVTPPLILNYSASTVPILQLALSGKGLSEGTMFDLAQTQIRPGLITVPGAALPLPSGGRTRQIQIDLDPQALQSKGLSAQDVTAAIAAQNQINPAGFAKIGGFQYAVRLNNAPGSIDELNAIPVKVVNGATIFMRDVAHVRDGSAPQVNVVHVDGARSVVMTVLKNGATSTLSIVQGIKDALPKLQETLPPALKIVAIGDQSLFVKAAVDGVVKEGMVAAALTSLMILLFLGSWRSTVIIAISIPLAVLAAIICLAITGNTLNTMTLGGLSLAVGILVDDATVTIENINWHLEQGKPVTQAILDGAAQIVTPAFVSLLCICVVFVPMFFLPGVAGFLFVPLALAVVFAMIASFILSRTLVPTMAMYLLRPHAPGEGHEAGRPGSRNPLVRFQRGFEQRFERIRLSYGGMLERVLAAPRLFVIGFVAIIGLSFLLLPFLGQNFFPSVDAGQMAIHVRAPVGSRLETTSAEFDRIARRIREVIPADELVSIVDNVGLPASAINVTYSNSGSVGSQDGDILIQLAKGPCADRRLCPRPARDVAARLPRHDLRLPAGRHHQPDPELWRAGPDRHPDRRQGRRRQRRLCQDNIAADRRHSRRGGRAHPAIDALSRTERRHRSQPDRPIWADRARRDIEPGGIAGGIVADLAGILPQPRQWRVLRRRRADPGISGRLDERSFQHPGDGQRHWRGATAGRARHDRPFERGGERIALQHLARDRHLRDPGGARSGCRGG